MTGEHLGPSKTWASRSQTPDICDRGRILQWRLLSGLVHRDLGTIRPDRDPASRPPNGFPSNHCIVASRQKLVSSSGVNRLVWSYAVSSQDWCGPLSMAMTGNLQGDVRQGGWRIHHPVGTPSLVGQPTAVTTVLGCLP